MAFSRGKMLSWGVNIFSLIMFIGVCFWFGTYILEHSSSRFNQRMAVYQVRSEFPDPKQEQLIILVIKGSVGATLSYAQTLPDGVNIVGKTGLTPLIAAVLDQDVSMVKALLKAGAHPNGALAQLPLTMAMRDPDPTIARLLLEAGADPNGRPGVSPPLIEAATMGHTDDIEVLLNAGARVDEPTSLGETALITAAIMDRFDLMHRLLDRGASLWTATNVGFTMADFVGTHCRRRSESNPDCARLITRIKAAHYPWPPPSVKEVKRLMDEGKWPPKEALGQ